MKKFYAYANNRFNYHTMPIWQCFYTSPAEIVVIGKHDCGDYSTVLCSFTGRSRHRRNGLIFDSTNRRIKEHEIR